MNFVVVYDPPGGGYWDLSDKFRQQILALEGVVDVRRSHVYSLQPEMFDGIDTPVTVICWGVEDRYAYEGRRVDEVVYVNGVMDIECVVSGKRLYRTGNHSFEWRSRENIPDSAVRKLGRERDAIPVTTYWEMPS